MSLNESLSDSETSNPPPNPTIRTGNKTNTRNNQNPNPYHSGPHYHTRQNLQNWLNNAGRGIDNNQANQIIHQTHTALQTTIHQQKDNQWWGDALLNDPPEYTFQIVSKNVNLLNTRNNYLEWKATASAA